MEVEDDRADADCGRKSRKIGYKIEPEAEFKGTPVNVKEQG